MSRPPTGSIRTTELRDGTRVFALRFLVNGVREHETLHERRDCDCGCGGGWTDRTARAELENVLSRVRAGVWERHTAPLRKPPERKRMPTFHEYASWWLEGKTDGSIGRRPIRANTRSDYVWRLRRHLLPFFGRYRLDEIDKDLCLAFKSVKLREAEELRAALAGGAVIRDPATNRRIQPLTLASVKKLLGTLAAVLDEAVEDEHIKVNPARSRRLSISAPAPARSFLEIDELVALIDAASSQDPPHEHPDVALDALGTRQRVEQLMRQGLSNEQIADQLGLARSTVGFHARRLGLAANGPYVGRRVVVATLGLSGVRASELCDLRVRHLRLHDPDGARLQIPDAKTQAGVRVVEMSPDLAAEWSAHLERLEEAQGSLDPDGWAVPSVRGGRMTRQRVAAIVRDAAREASIKLVERGRPPLPQTTPHSLRRTYISIALVANNFDVLWVMSQVGHSDSKMTMDVYAQLQQRVKRDHGKAFDALIRHARNEPADA